MSIRNPKIRIGVLFLLVLLPVFFPFAHREHCLIPYEVMDETGLIALLYVIYFLLSLPYWYIVGIVFRRWVNSFAKSFLLANLPIFMNAIAEILYYGVFHMKQGSYPLLEYFIGSHIDKFNIEWIKPIIPSILFSTACFLLFFYIGYAPSRSKRNRHLSPGADTI